MKIGEWLLFSEKSLPNNCHEVLCAWRKGNEWTYEVLIHWPDGLWTDLGENDLEQELGWFPPLLWMEIMPPSMRDVKS